MLDRALQTVQSRNDLTQAEMREAIGEMMQGRCSEESMARFLTTLHEKGETVAEIAGAATALRENMTPIHTRHTVFIDTCGTGGDGSKTFNISTAAALVTAACGVPVAKHGNRSYTSKSGSADVLSALGVNIEADVETVEACLDELGICFCFAPLLHRAMKHIAPVRKSLGTPTIFNLLGPLANPANAPFQLLGVGKAYLQPLLAEALVLLGTQRAVTVHGSDGLDEVTLDGKTSVLEATGSGVQSFSWEPADFGFSPVGKESMIVDRPEDSAAIIQKILAGEKGPPRDIVVINAAAALWTVGRAASLRDGAQIAADAIDTSAAADLLRRLSDKTRPNK